MSVTGQAERVAAALLDAEALIEKARDRQRKRRFLIGFVVLIALVLSGVVYTIVSRPSARARSTRTSSPTKTVSASQSGPYVVPEAPYALAVAPNGDLLVVDSGRDQILRRLPSGKFQVLAGNGERGFSGDGDPAVRAEINVDNWAGIAVARNGTVYFADDGNARVREILPSGIIKTVAGGGTRVLRLSPMPALVASLGRLAGLTIGPNGELYIAADAVYRLGPGGILHWVVGKSFRFKDWPKGWRGVFSNPAIQSDFAPAYRLAFDAKGDLLVAGGGGGWGIYEMARSGRLRFLGAFRAEDGSPPSLAEETGYVVLAYNAGVFRLSPSGRLTRFGPSPMVQEPTSTPPALDKALGRMGGGPAYNTFVGGDGLTVAAQGDIYVDTNRGNGWTSVSAILELRPNGKVVALWRSRGCHGVGHDKASQTGGRASISVSPTRSTVAPTTFPSCSVALPPKSRGTTSSRWKCWT